VRATFGVTWRNGDGQATPARLDVEAAALVLTPAEGGEPARLLAQQVGPAVTVGWRVRLDEDSVVYADTSAVPRFAGDGEPGRYLSTRGGIEWKLSESRFGFDRGRRRQPPPDPNSLVRRDVRPQIGRVHFDFDRVAHIPVCDSRLVVGNKNRH